MKEIEFTGIVKEYGQDNWGFETEHMIYSADVCSGIDELIEHNVHDISKNGEHVKIIIQLLDR